MVLASEIVKVTPLFDLFLYSLFFILYCFSNVFLISFPSLTNDTHIFGPTYVAPFAFNHFIFQLAFMGSAI
jgi:hypothetical protein